MLILFGGTGDLARKKIFPALKSIGAKNIIALGRSFNSQKDFNEGMGLSSHNITYIQQKIGDNPEKIIDEIKKNNDDRLVIYVAVFNGEVSLMKLTVESSIEIFRSSNHARKIIAFEKPIGVDVSTSSKIVGYTDTLKSKGIEVIFIDHFLYKCDEQSTHICPQKVTVIAIEDKTIQGREKFWDSSKGIISDMVQNHIMQLVKHIAQLKIDAFRYDNFVCNDVEFDPKGASKYPVYMDFSCEYTHDSKKKTILRIECGKYRKERKTIVQVDDIFFDLTSSKGDPYSLLFSDLLFSSKIKIRKVSREDILESWKIMDKIPCNKGI